MKNALGRKWCKKHGPLPKNQRKNGRKKHLKNHRKNQRKKKQQKNLLKNHLKKNQSGLRRNRAASLSSSKRARSHSTRPSSGAASLRNHHGSHCIPGFAGRNCQYPNGLCSNSGSTN